MITRRYCRICGTSFSSKNSRIVRGKCPECWSSLHDKPMVYLPMDDELNDLIKDTTRATGMEASELMKNAIRIYQVAMSAIKRTWKGEESNES